MWGLSMVASSLLGCGFAVRSGGYHGARIRLRSRHEPRRLVLGAGGAATGAPGSSDAGRGSARPRPAGVRVAARFGDGLRQGRGRRNGRGGLLGRRRGWPLDGGRRHSQGGGAGHGSSRPSRLSGRGRAARRLEPPRDPHRRARAPPARRARPQRRRPRPVPGCARARGGWATSRPATLEWSRP